MKKDKNTWLWVALAGGGLYLWYYYKQNGRMPWQAAAAPLSAVAPATATQTSGANTAALPSTAISSGNDLATPSFDPSTVALASSTADNGAPPVVTATPIVSAPVQVPIAQNATVVTPEQSPTPGTETINPYTSTTPSPSAPGYLTQQNNLTLNKIAATAAGKTMQTLTPGQKLFS